MVFKPPNPKPMLSCPLAKLLKRKKCFFQTDRPAVFLIGYKLLQDSLFLLLLFFAFMLIAEGLLPGLITARVGFPKILIAITLNILGIKFFAQKIAPTKNSATISQKNNGKFFPALSLFVAMLLLLNAQRTINFWLNLSITLIFALIGWQFYRLFFEKEKSNDSKLTP